MCGIYGIVGKNRPVREKFLRGQISFLSHRGPDGENVWLSSSRKVGLAHSRLAVIDLSRSAEQPIFSKDGRLGIICNGELYNYKELRQEIGNRYDFSSNSDSEVILAAYAVWGGNCLQKLEGMYAFAIYDAGDQIKPEKVFLARDRAGEKPIYIKNDENGFQFASELKAISGNKTLDIHSVNFYFARGYVPSGKSIVRGIYKLLPGHALVYEVRSDKKTEWSYWDLPDRGPAFSEIELLDKVEALFEESVKLKLRSDVPIGILLSGGLDSSLILSVASRFVKDLKTFTVSFPGTSQDESSRAELIASNFGADHHVLKVTSLDLGSLEKLSMLVDEPIADSSIIPTFLISNFARKHVKVVLGGDGGDELFGGYPIYSNTLNDCLRLGFLPDIFFRTAAQFSRLLPVGTRGRNRLLSMEHGPSHQMIWGSLYFDRYSRNKLMPEYSEKYSKVVREKPESYLISEFKRGKGLIDSMTRTHFKGPLLDDFLVKVDRASMANGLEVRAPFLDRKLVEFAFSSIPDGMKVQAGVTRVAQRLLARRLLPKNFQNQKKQGFQVPLDQWFRDEKCRSVIDHMTYLPSVIDKKYVEKIVDLHKKGFSNGHRLFSILMFGIASKNNGWIS